MRVFSYKIKDYLFFRVLICVLVFSIIGPLVFLHHLNRDTGFRDFTIQSFQSRTKLDKTYGKDEFLLERLEEYRRQIKELERIKLSLSNELRDLEGKRHVIQKDIQKLHESAERLQVESRSVKDLVNLAKRKLDVYKLEKSRISQCPQLPHMRLPKPPESSLIKQTLSYSKEAHSSCNLAKCFDFSQCPYAGGFSIYVYNPTNHLIDTSTSLDILSTYKMLKDSSYYTSNAKNACVYVVLVGFLYNLSTEKDKNTLENNLRSLPHWNGDGRNHFLLQIKSSTNFYKDVHRLGVDFGMAFVGQSSFLTSHLRPGFDLVIPPINVSQSTEEELWKQAPPQLPAFRKYFLSFEGEVTKTGQKHIFVSAEDLISLSKEANNFYILTNCRDSGNKSGFQMDWMLCGSHETRISTLKRSTFTIIPGPIENLGYWDSTHIRLIEALQCGAIPVILNDIGLLPFNDMIDWHLAAIIIPPARITELNTLLHTITVNDLLKLRQQGRFLWENYLSTPKVILNSILAAVRTRLSLPAEPLLATPSMSVFTTSNKPLINPPDPDAILELPIKSPTFTRNFTTTVSFVRHQWNTAPGALHSFPSTPFEPVLPSSVSFMNSTTEFEHIGGGKGGSGGAFSRAQGGNYPKEQFTVVILTYERELVLMESMQRLVGLQYLNKVVVVWNSPLTPSPSLRWPDIGVPVHVIKTSKNSLNNRFIPYDVIETDAILSIDDDVELRHDEILLAFRVWRENRDRIVGFPGRYHSWDSVNKKWTYASKYACELSLILTGAAFIHRYYFYLYTHWMPNTITNKVDEYMNCEDIAMNFLVSHITRKPPLKVTSRWTFLCSSCPVSLWEDKSHFEERHECMNFFERVYGYMPLLKTQYRADSVLFKTRIPSAESKCFKYV